MGRLDRRTVRVESGDEHKPLEMAGEGGDPGERKEGSWPYLKSREEQGARERKSLIRMAL